MKKKVMKKWVKALRSGEYPQVKGSMCKKLNDGRDGFCCLGVLTNIYCEETGKGFDELFASYYETFSGDKLETGSVPAPVAKWAGLKQRSPLKGELADINDRGKRFKTIAKIIEERYKEI